MNRRTRRATFWRTARKRLVSRIEARSGDVAVGKVVENGAWSSFR